MNDTSGDSWLAKASDYITTGTNIWGAITGTNPASSSAPPAATAAAAVPKTNWLLYGGIGAAVLVVLALVLRK